MVENNKPETKTASPTLAKTPEKVEAPKAQEPEQKVVAVKAETEKSVPAKKKATKVKKKSAASKSPAKAKKKSSAKKKAAANTNSKTKTKKAAAQSIPQTAKIVENVMTQGKTQFDKLAQDAAANGKEQYDAFLKSSTLFMKGFEDIAKTYTAWAQTSVEKNTQAVKALLSSKTLNEYTETQNKLAQQNFDDFFAGATKISELSVKVTTDALAPINDQVGKTVKKATDSLAA